MTTTNTTAIPATTPTTQASVPTFLRRVVAADRIASGVSAAVVLLGSIWLADLLNWSIAAVLALGLILVVNTALLHAIHRSDDQDGALIRASIGIDLVFACAVAGIAFSRADDTSVLGLWLLGATSLFVLDVAIAKTVGLRRLIRR